MKGIAMLTTLTTFIIVLIGWTNAAPSTLRSSRSLSEKKEYGRGNAVIGGIEEVSIGHSSNTDILRMPSRQALLEQQQQQADALEDDELLLRRPTKTRESTLVAPASADSFSEKNLLSSEVGDWDEQQDRKMTVLETKAYEIPIDAITVSLRSWTNLVG
jgi:hypothetical protein